MYLTQAYIENSGPLTSLKLDLPFTHEGFPEPVVLVGMNGSGKTNFLSIIADALIEGASQHYSDVVPAAAGQGRQYFRVVGPVNITSGAAGGYSLLVFAHDGERYAYVEKAGRLDPSQVSGGVPEALRQHMSWSVEGAYKRFAMPGDIARTIFVGGAYSYFPSSRSELPHWLNPNSLATPSIDIRTRFVNELQKPMYIERGLEALKGWMLSLLLDARVDFTEVPTASGQMVGVALGDLTYPKSQQHVWNSLNVILRTILDSPTARFVWAGRKSRPGLGFLRDGTQSVALPLDSLSAGQASLFNVFASVLRNGDDAFATAADVTGIVIVDEVDAHMHVDLQFRALPSLLRLFPKVQFLLSCHSPLFVLGMSREFGERLHVIDMPTGTSIGAESYTEFARALAVFNETKAFDALVVDRVATHTDRLLVMLEGETDPRYMQAACELLGRADILERVDFDWVGDKDPHTNQARNTGVSALNSMFRLLQSNPELVHRPVLLLYDNDASKPSEDHRNLHVRSAPSNASNAVVRKGVENLLREDVITDDFFSTERRDDGNGKRVTTQTLNKVNLCNEVCDVRRNAEDFEAFPVVLAIIDDLLALSSDSSLEEAEGGAKLDDPPK